MSFDKKDYPGIPYTNYDHNQALDESSEKLVDLPDVPLAFSKISTLGNYYFISDGNCFSRVAYTAANNAGGAAINHFQGIIRHHDGQYFIISGGDSVESTAQIFCARLESKLNRVHADTNALSTYEKGMISRDHLGYNSILYNHIPTTEKVMYITKINDDVPPHYWHAGGISNLRNIYLVPLESSKNSKVRFYYLAGPDKFLHINAAEIDRPGTEEKVEKAGASAFCRLKNDRYLIAIWQDGNKNGTQNIDFYLSKTTSIVDGFLSPIRWFYRNCLSSDNIDVTYQNIQFLTQDDGQLFLVGSENKSNASPKVKGENILELLQIDFNIDIHGNNVGINLNPTIRLINKKLFRSHVLYNFDAGASIYINKQKELILYSVYHYIRDKSIRIVEFPTGLEPSGPSPGNIHFARIELFEDENFGGRVLRLYGDIQAEVKKTSDLYLEGKKFNKGFKSVKFQLPINTTFSIYSKFDFKNEFSLKGDGLMHAIAKVANIKNFGDEIKSTRFTKVGNPNG